MTCIHNFIRSETGEVSCSICYALDDEMPQSEIQHAEELDNIILDEKIVERFLSKEEDFWSTQVSFE